MTAGHLPVMVAEALRFLAPERGGFFVDCTVGLGGHTRALIDAGATQVLGFDRDLDALSQARQLLSDIDEGLAGAATAATPEGNAVLGKRIELVHADYRELAAQLDARGRQTVDGVLADLGVSSLQLDSTTRGFSFRHDAPLDMRMDTSRGPTAADLLRDVDETTLANLIFELGEERYSRRIARGIVRAQQDAPITTTGQLADIVRRNVPRRGYQRIDPATRTFQALRIWVNGELEGLDEFVRTATRYLRPGARLAIITFHSLEDRIVKHTLRELDRERGLLQVLTKKPVEATEVEIDANPRARSAKLRAAERVTEIQVAQQEVEEHDGGARE
jgi:16S rRNA (cytosine1402-N4)-methyltransferase